MSAPQNETPRTALHGLSPIEDWIRHSHELESELEIVREQLRMTNEMLAAATKIKSHNWQIEECPGGGWHVIYPGIRDDISIGCNSPSPQIAYAAHLAAIREQQGD